MFQVNGHSLVGSSHPHAVQVLKSAGCDVVAVVIRSDASRPSSAKCEAKPFVAASGDRLTTNIQPSPTASALHSKIRQSAEHPSNLSVPCRTPSSLVKLGDQQSTEKKCESKEHLTAVDSQSSLSHHPLQTSKGHSTVTDSRTGPCHRPMWSRIEHLTVVDSETSLSHCPVPSSSRCTQRGVVANPLSSSSSSSSTLKQDGNDDNDGTVSLHSYDVLQGSQPEDQVLVMFSRCGRFF